MLLYTCLSENGSDELKLSNSHVNRRYIKLLVSCILYLVRHLCISSTFALYKRRDASSEHVFFLNNGVLSVNTKFLA